MGAIDRSALNRPESLRKFVAPEFVFGIGARLLVARYAANLELGKILVVSDPGVEAAGWTGELVAILEAAGFPLASYSRVSPNPRSGEVMDGAEVFLRERCNSILAVGGGSPMDCAKGIGIVVAERRSILEFEGVDQVSVPIPPLICVPTTGGTSADVSQFAIITNCEQKTKIAIISKAVVPDVALIDPSTLISMPDALSVATGMDALTHAFEAYASNAQSPVTDVLALEAARLLFEYLPRSLKEPRNLEYRAQVMLGSLDAGLAFSNASLGAVHAMAHAAGGLLDIAHGDCNSILLPHVVRYNFSAVPHRYRTLAEASGIPSVELVAMRDDRVREALVDRIIAMQRMLSAPRRFADYGMTRENLPRLAEMAMKDACMATNPRRPTASEIERIYEAAL
ncbi:MAG: iron-containing alcohol dehydrogenase [Deltaproteobacteria bacterium]|nr:iron-containing alcohol dehydrogenase [Deltaproteobacteria bacterium]